jgi:hypothetical protein
METATALTRGASLFRNGSAAACRHNVEPVFAVRTTGNCANPYCLFVTARESKRWTSEWIDDSGARERAGGGESA